MKPKVVVVDDEPAIVDVLIDTLDFASIAAESCPHGHQAYMCIRSKAPGLVILDVQMPGVDGIQLFQQMRADPALKAIPVIFLTANAHKVEEQLPNYGALGAMLLPKPFQVNVLLQLVERALELT